MINKEYDIIIRNGYIVDGTGNPWYRGDIAIKNGKIASIENFISEKSAMEIIDARNKIVSPGFIDLHNHSDINILAMPSCESLIRQGVTTAVVGNCGWSLAPMNKKYISELREYFAPLLSEDYDYGWDWISFKEYYQKVEKREIAINIAPLVGQGSIRIAVKGFSNDSATTQEMGKMKELLRQSIKEGAYGLSSGLGYPPGCYSSTEELIELCSELKNYRKPYISHIRNYSQDFKKSVEEAIEIGRKNQIPVHISHLAAKGKDNWGKVNKILEILEKAREEGIEISCDVYPYTRGSSTITSILPTWVLEGGIQKMLSRLKDIKQRQKIKTYILEQENDIRCIGLDGIIISSCENQHYEGKSLKEIIKFKGSQSEPIEATFDLLIELNGKATVIKVTADEKDMQSVLAHPLSAIMSDSWATNPAAKGKPHPRTYGAFPRALGRYVREKKLMRLEAGIRKMTSFPASIMRIKGRGLLKEGFFADITIFDPDIIADCATYQNPHCFPRGIDYVIINGEIAVEGDRLKKVSCGKVLKNDI